MLALAGFCGMCGSLADQKKGASLQMSCNALMMRCFERSWDASVGLKVENTSGCKLAWCEEDKARVTVEDSFGNKAGRVSCCWGTAAADDDSGIAFLVPHGWKPAVGSTWVRVKGEIPFAVFLRSAVSEPVTVKLVKDFSVPVVLKGAGLVGEDGKPLDVNAVLMVKDFVDAGEKGKKQLTLELSVDRMLRWLGFELQTTDGQPVFVDNRGGGGPIMSSFLGNWSKTLQLDDGLGGEVRVVVRYAEKPRRMMAAIDSYASLSGFGGGDGRDAGGKKAAPGAGRNSEAGEGSATSAAVAVHPGLGKEPAVNVNLESFDIMCDPVLNNIRQDSPPQLIFRVRLESQEKVGFVGHAISGEQSLAVTDSTGCVLKPAVFDLNHAYQEKDNGAPYMFIEGKGPELASPGAEWIRVKGTLRVPMAQVKESPVYELPLVNGAELYVPVPVMEKTGDDAGDVAKAGDAPACKLGLEAVDRKAGDELAVKVSLRVDEVSFGLDGFELVDDKGKTIDAERNGSYSFSEGSRKEWGRRFIFRKVAGMKPLRVKLKYKAEPEMVSVPVDIKVGLGGPVPEKKAGAGNAAGDGKH